MHGMKASLGTLAGLLLLGTQASCGSAPPSRPVYQDPITSIRVQEDSQAGLGHSHPAKIPPEQMALLLSGIRVQPRQNVVSSIVSGEAERTAAFSPAEMKTLAVELPKALEQARPNELVTFYRRVSDASIGLGYTTGGLFLNDAYLYFILANHRTMPSSVLGQAMTYELDPVDSPLLPLNRGGFSVSFSPVIAQVPDYAHQPWRYVDEGRLVVIDLRRIPVEVKPSSPGP